MAARIRDRSNMGILLVFWVLMGGPCYGQRGQSVPLLYIDSFVEEILGKDLRLEGAISEIFKENRIPLPREGISKADFLKAYEISLEKLVRRASVTINMGSVSLYQIAPSYDLLFVYRIKESGDGEIWLVLECGIVPSLTSENIDHLVNPANWPKFISTKGVDRWLTKEGETTVP